MPQRPTPFQPPATSPVSVVSENDKLRLRKAVILSATQVRTAVTIQSMVVDLSLAKVETVRFWIDSSLDQPVALDFYGSVTFSATKVTTIMAAFPVLAQQISTYGVLPQDWFPFMSCLLTPLAMLPITGDIAIEVYWQEEKK